MALKLANEMYSMYIEDYYGQYLVKSRIIRDLTLNLENIFYGAQSYNGFCRYCNCKFGCNILDLFTENGSQYSIQIERKDINILFKSLFKKLSDTNGLILSYLVQDTCQFC